MFAGPNGSGKSTIKNKLHPRLLGVYINPNDIERDLRLNGYLDFAAFGLQVTENALREFLEQANLIHEAGLGDAAARLTYSTGKLFCARDDVNSYLASVLADFVRRRLMASRQSFSFETVMSHPSKVELLEAARKQDYRTYLYYVATDDPQINISRVAHRVSKGGHDVPEDKIRERYTRSLDLLLNAIRATRRAYIFENSGEDCQWLAEITHGREIELKMDSIPAWFQRAVLDKIPQKDAS